ncbi:DMT family transporter [Thermochromatium tepidum]|uniref:EamA family transporter n=1 Tax=Thermochromatium tepidum ATCC 43061 TaxID=316276 RepID=A0A6I6EBL3_THETI|nr:DMT family transporter [Thermochromatium tepidum]QGU32329.1 EamA family transporter [Thermochromatium tepidum ATCC 43061]
MSWIALALICAFALASADAATKAWLQDLTASELLVVRFCIPALLMTPLLSGMPPITELPWAFWGWMGVMLPLEMAAMWLYATAIRDHPLSLTLPYLAFTPVFVIGVAWLLLGEQISARGVLGILLVVAGAWLLNSDHAHWRHWRGWIAPFVAIFDAPGARMMLGVATLYALTATLGKGAMRYLPPESFGAFYFALLGITVAVFVVLPRPSRLRGLARHPWAVLLVGGGLGVMVFTHFLAIQQVEVAYMIAVKRTSLLFGILYGALCFREPGLSRRLPAGVLMLAGVVLIVI